MIVRPMESVSKEIKNHAIPEFRVMGDRSLIACFGEEIDRAVNDRIRKLFVYLHEHPIEGVVEAVPAYSSLLFIFDPIRIPSENLRQEIMEKVQAIDHAVIPAPETVEIPVVYGGEYGPDLEWVARYHSISEEEVVRLHTREVYHVYMIGFTPGFAYMGELSTSLATPRKETPRTAVPRGSVGLAQEQTGIYPSESPGGWQIIGRTALKLFDPAKMPPSLLRMGDRVRFFAVSTEDAESWEW